MALLLALLVGTADAAILRVGGATGNVTNGNSVTVTYTTTGGNSVLVWVGIRVAMPTDQGRQGMWDDGTLVLSVTDSGGSTYTRLARTQTGSNYTMELWGTAVNAAVASTTVTVNYVNHNSAAVVVEEYSGATIYGVPQHQTWVSNSGGVTSEAHVRTQDANNFLVAGFGVDQNITYTASVGTLRNEVHAADPLCLAVLDNTAAASGAYLVCRTTNGPSPWCGCSMELRTTAGPNPAINLVGWGYNEFRGGDLVRDNGIIYPATSGNTIVVASSFFLRDDAFSGVAGGQFWTGDPTTSDYYPRVTAVVDNSGGVYTRRIMGYTNSTSTARNTAFEIWSTEPGGSRWSRIVSVDFAPPVLVNRYRLDVTYPEAGFYVLEYSGVVALGGTITAKGVVGANTPCPPGLTFPILDTGNVVVEAHTGSGQVGIAAFTPVANSIPYVCNRGAGASGNGWLCAADSNGTSPVTVGLVGQTICGFGALELRSANSNSTFTVTPSGTYTASFTATRTATATNTSTRTATPTNTGANSPTETNTINPSFSNTNTPTHTRTATFTNTHTLTMTPSETLTSTQTATVTATATRTPTPTPTYTERARIWRPPDLDR